MTNLTVKEFLKQDVDIDVYDELSDGEICMIAYVGKHTLTNNGEKYYKTILNNTVEICDDGDYEYAIVNCEDEYEAELIADLFECLAGYCDEEFYDEMFVELEG